MIVQLDPPIPLETPKGRGVAHLVIDYGTEHSLIWQTFIDDTGESWLFRNEEVRLQPNWTFGRKSVSKLKDEEKRDAFYTKLSKGNFVI